MTEIKLKTMEPLFGEWYVSEKVAEGKSSVIYKVFSEKEGKIKYKAVEIMKFPSGNDEISRALESEKFSTVNEYLIYARQKVCANIEKMMTLKSNKNIVSYSDYTIVKENSCFYVLILRELLTPLSDYIKNNRVRKKDAVKIGWDICNALESFRKIGIMHCNIKPENIFVDNNSNYKLGDFGVDSAFRKKSGLDSYRAPESGESGEKSADIYALGIILYRILNNGRAPFLPAYPAPVALQDRERAETRRLRGDMFPMPANADSDLAHIIFTATAYNGTDRYESPEQMKYILEEYVKNVLLVARSPIENEEKRNNTYAPEPYSVEKKGGAASVTFKDKQAFVEAFRDDESTVEEKSYKKWYVLIGVLIVILAITIVLLTDKLSASENEVYVGNTGDAYNGTLSGNVITTETEQENTTGSETDLQEDTSAEEITEQETSDWLTTETETTEELTTEEITTEEVTTQEQTTEQVTVTEESSTVPSISAGATDESGRVYYELSSCQVVFPPQSETDKEIVIELNGVIGGEPTVESGAYIYMYNEGVLIVVSELELELIESVDSDSYFCYMTIKDYDFFYSAEDYEYYVYFADGAIKTDTGINMACRIDF